MEKVVGLALIVAGILTTVLFVVPRVVDGFQMREASVCSATETGNCLEEVEVEVTGKDERGPKNVGPVTWHLELTDGDEQILRTTWLGEGLVVGTDVSLQLWDGDPVAVRDRGDEVHSLAWGANRWILWAAGALALLLPGLTLVFLSFRPRAGDDEEPEDVTTVAAAQVMLSVLAALFMYPAYSGAGALGAAIVLGGLVWFNGALLLRGSRPRARTRQARGLA